MIRYVERNLKTLAALLFVEMSIPYVLTLNHCKVSRICAIKD